VYIFVVFKKVENSINILIILKNILKTEKNLAPCIPRKRPKDPKNKKLTNKLKTIKSSIN